MAQRKAKSDLSGETSGSREQRVAAFLRRHLAERYALDQIRRYPGFDGLSDAHVSGLRAFGLAYIYPEWDARCFQNAAFEAILALLSDPMRLRPLTAVALKSLWRFGRRLPRAIDAGKSVLAAFEATRSLENRLMELLEEPGEADAAEEADILRAVGRLSSEEMEAFIGQMVALMHLLADRELLETGASVLADIAAAMDKRDDAYTEIEREGLHYALRVLNEGMALFDALDPEAIKNAIDALVEVERDWRASILEDEA